jgi:hypothetical protein
MIRALEVCSECAHGCPEVEYQAVRVAILGDEPWPRMASVKNPSFEFLAVYELLLSSIPPNSISHTLTALSCNT